MDILTAIREAAQDVRAQSEPTPKPATPVKAKPGAARVAAQNKALARKVKPEPKVKRRPSFVQKVVTVDAPPIKARIVVPANDENLTAADKLYLNEMNGVGRGQSITNRR